MLATFVSVITWHRSLACEQSIRARIDSEELRLWALGMHSIIFIADEPGDSAAVLVSRCADHAAAATIAEHILGEALIRIDALRFDDPATRPAWLTPAAKAPRPARRTRRREPTRLAA
jgi:hypothetical protein